jgi:tetratricopeptide (TPR) repeat protein
MLFKLFLETRWRTESVRFYACIVLFALLSNCAYSPDQHAKSLTVVESLEQTSSLDHKTLNDVNVLALDQRAVVFIERQVAGVTDPHEQLRALRKAIFDPNGLNFHYDSTVTQTAGETFDAATGNCLSLANFFVAAIRYLGIEAEYQEVRHYGLRTEDDLRVVERHINVSGRLSARTRYVVDFLAVPEEDFAKAVVISDQRALAHYYNNLGIERLQNDDIEVALQYLKKAISVDSGVDFVWSNLGVIYSRRGDLLAAEFAYQRALALNRNNDSAMNNLVALYNKIGRTNDAEHYNELLKKHRLEL